ncbi:hypothetical protein LUZ61_004341 [Rhynchospora tenuis]|uniref:Uncharacterized protein n=1 Tax=Rhynchospora tenuis TaxID=198213 RepID=A0AAD5ZMG7_9POAL|nr:hypothetical protein LUZ61_004341 [Rhynchospora tenuis]
MERQNLNGLSWADQWDTGDYLRPTPVHESRTKRMQKVTAKAKASAFKGLKKMKKGTMAGVQWIKDKYQRRKSQRN